MEKNFENGDGHIGGLDTSFCYFADDVVELTWKFTIVCLSVVEQQLL